MRLTHIKLAGFKSFVDPTHIPVPGQLVGVVGPNGCGKSNVIDAVRWVLGESSAKQLRGESMQDVIFNGSGERKPVSRASVELIFDNSLGKAAGAWAQYGEISVKRVLERDGESSYFINNMHVRRRDVADIFLGTGLGGRGYAIIEQGMISRIIEARPEDLRSFLEEAAGVSKYRERRRETELRLEDTRENLLRVEDIRQELGKQLEHLESQAEKAGRYREFEAGLKRTQHLLWLLRKRDAGIQHAKATRDIETTAVELEAQTAALRESERKLEELRSGHYGASDAVHAAQGALYEVNAEIARIEQQVQFLRDSRRRAEHQLASVRAQEREQTERAQSQSLARQESERQLATAEEQAGELEDRLREARAALPAAEEAYRTAQAALAAAAQGLSQAEQQLQLEGARKSHTDRLVQQFAARRTRLEEERDGLEVPNLSELVRLEKEVSELGHRLAGERQALEECESQLPGLEATVRTAEQEAEQAQQRLNQLDARLTALQALQEQVSRAGELDPWLDRHGLRRNPHLWQGLRIREGWEDALEAVLRERLNSVGLEDLDQVHAWLSDAPPGKVSFHRLGAGAAAPAGTQGLEKLADYVTCTDARLSGVLGDWLAGVYVLHDAAQGVEAAVNLVPGALLVTAQGHMFSATSVSFHAADSEVHGILSRQREIENLFSDRNAADETLAILRKAVQAADAELGERKVDAERLRRTVGEWQETHHRLKIEHIHLAQLAERLKVRGEQIVSELAEIDAEVQRETAQLAQADRQIEALSTNMSSLAASVEAGRREFEIAESQLQDAREQARVLERQHQEAEFQSKTILNKIREITESIEVVSRNRGRLAEEAASLSAEMEQADEAPLQEQLQSQLQARSEREQALRAARTGLEEIDARLRETEQERLGAEQKLAP